MNTGYNNIGSPSLNGLVDITADNISSTSITVSDLILENSLNITELNFTDNINGVTTNEFAEIPNISNNHIDILELQKKTQNIYYADTTPLTQFIGLTNFADITFDNTINNIDLGTFSSIGEISGLAYKTQYITNEGSFTSFSNDAVYYYNALYKGVASYEGVIQYNNTFTGFNNSGSGVNISVEEFECLDGVTSSIQSQLNVIDANRIADGSVTNTEFQCLDGITSSIQSQLDSKESSTSTSIDVSRLADGSVTNTEFQYINTLSSNCQTQLNSKESSTSVNIDVGRLADGTVNNTEFEYLDGVTSSIQLQLDGKESNISINIDANRISDGTVNNTKFQFINSLTSNVQSQLNNKPNLNTTNSFTGYNRFYNNVSIEPNYSLEVEGDGYDTTESIGVFSGSMFLYKGFIRGRDDGFNYANDTYDKYTGYCYNLSSTPVSAVDGVTTALSGIRTLPQGVYSISGVIGINKGSAGYNLDIQFSTSWTATGGTVPAVNNYQYIPASAGNLRVALPSTYFIVTGSGVLKPNYSYNFGSLGTSTAFFNVSIVRIA